MTRVNTRETYLLLSERQRSGLSCCGVAWNEGGCVPAWCPPALATRQCAVAKIAAKREGDLPPHPPSLTLFFHPQRTRYSHRPDKGTLTPRHRDPIWHGRDPPHRTAEIRPSQDSTMKCLMCETLINIQYTHTSNNKYKYRGWGWGEFCSRESTRSLRPIPSSRRVSRHRAIRSHRWP